MTSVDTNVIIGLLDTDDAFNRDAKKGLREAATRGPLIICAPVYVELCALPKRQNFVLDEFLKKVRIDVDWLLDEQIWRAAGVANGKHVARRRESIRAAKQKNLPKLEKRAAADFIIGAHALIRGTDLLTFDQGVFRTYFPAVSVFEL